jgi:hypothetical protein
MSFDPIVQFLQTLPAEGVLGLEYIFCCLALLGMFKAFGRTGLFIYIALAVIIANIQVLKAVHFSFFSFPVALGTILFSSTFLASDILTEFYGSSIARQGVWVGFSAALLTIGFMTLTLGIRPAETEDQVFIDVHKAIATLFSPHLALFTASLLSYGLSQYTDIWIFQMIRRFTGHRWLWVRAAGSSLLSAFLDNVLFSTLAWVVFAEKPLSLESLVLTYILGTYIFRVVVMLVQIPLMYSIRTWIARGSYAYLSKFSV